MLFLPHVNAHAVNIGVIHRKICDEYLLFSRFVGYNHRKGGGYYDLYS